LITQGSATRVCLGGNGNSTGGQKILGPGPGATGNNIDYKSAFKGKILLRDEQERRRLKPHIPGFKKELYGHFAMSERGWPLF